MSLLFGKTCAAFTWNADNECFGVLMRQAGSSYKVKRFWSDKVNNSDEISGALRRGAQSLGVHDTTIIIACSSTARTSSADLSMPLLKHKDMLNALQFNVSKQSPLEQDELAWGYRILDPQASNGTPNIRVLLMRETVWSDWVDKTGSLPTGVDLLIPAVAVSDTVIKDRGVFLGKISEETGIYTSPADEGPRQLICSRLDDIKTRLFGYGEQPLESPVIDPGKLSKAAAEEQAGFVDAVLLGAYGLTKEFSRDLITWRKVPTQMQPKRYIFAKSIAATLAVFIVLMSVFHASRFIADKSKQVNAVKSTINMERIKLKNLKFDPKKLSTVKDILQDMKDHKIQQYSTPEVLLELTERMPDKFWVTNFTLTLDSIKCSVKTTDGDVEHMVQAMKLSPLFDKDDVRIFPRNTYTQLELKVVRKDQTSDKDPKKPGAK